MFYIDEWYDDDRPIKQEPQSASMASSSASNEEKTVELVDDEEPAMNQTKNEGNSF